jgi:hypothetical protein
VTWAYEPNEHISRNFTEYLDEILRIDLKRVDPGSRQTAIVANTTLSAVPVPEKRIIPYSKY